MPQLLSEAHLSLQGASRQRQPANMSEQEQNLSFGGDLPSEAAGKVWR